MLRSRRVLLNLTLVAAMFVPVLAAASASAAGRADHAEGKPVRAVTPVPQSPKQNKGWMSRHERKLEEARKNADKIQMVFIGDSITWLWEVRGKTPWKKYYAPRGALNLGFDGDKTQNVIWRLQHGEVDGLTHVKLVVLMIGTNNTGIDGDKAVNTAAGIKVILDELRTRLPQAKVLLLAIFPRGAKPTDKKRVRNEEVNKIIAGYADGEHIFFKDIGGVFLEKDGTMSKKMSGDLLHPEMHGYRFWAQAMEPTVKELMGSSD